MFNAKYVKPALHKTISETECYSVVVSTPHVFESWSNLSYLLFLLFYPQKWWSGTLCTWNAHFMHAVYLPISSSLLSRCTSLA